MTKQEVIQQLQPIFREVFMDESLNISEDLTAENVEAWDSLSHIDMIIRVEEEFQIKIPTLKAASMKNTGELITLISESQN